MTSRGLSSPCGAASTPKGTRRARARRHTDLINKRMLATVINIKADSAHLPLRLPAGAVREGRVDLCVRPRRGLGSAGGSAKTEAREMSIDLGAR
jgi:hypothetical protein